MVVWQQAPQPNRTLETDSDRSVLSHHLEPAQMGHASPHTAPDDASCDGWNCLADSTEGEREKVMVIIILYLFSEMCL